jgi:hypothetical protein
VPIVSPADSNRRYAREQQELAKRRLRQFITEGTAPELGP